MYVLSNIEKKCSINPAVSSFLKPHNLKSDELLIEMSLVPDRVEVPVMLALASTSII